MHFRTQIPIKKSDQPIGYDSKVVSLGSCFAVNIAEKFQYFNFQNTVNPFGILFHPLSLEKFIGFAVNRKQFTEDDIFFHNERWHCFDAHSELSSINKHDMLDKLNAAVSSANNQITQSTHIIITLGTAWVYSDIESGEMVANCHKLPQKQFHKKLLTVEAIGDSLMKIVAMLNNANPEIKIIFTISPVRHIKDGFVENQWSKANLISALHEFLSIPTIKFKGHYFPSYEIMMDELRDYRFYAEDMLHPNSVAVDYIWKRFSETWILENAIPIMDEVDNIRKGIAHRPFNPNSQQHKDFMHATNKRISILQGQFPHFTFQNT